MDDVKKIKLKTSDQLNAEDKKYITEHPTEFNDEDRTAWSDVLSSSSDAGQSGTAGEPSTAGNSDLGTGDGGGSSDAGTPTTDDPPTPPADATPQSPVFKTEEEARTFVRKEQERYEKEKKAAVDAAAPADKKWVEENWKPKDWNEPIKLIKDAVKEELKADQDAAVKADNARRDAAQADWQKLRTENKLPDVINKDGSENQAGIDLQNRIVDIGRKFNKKNFKDAYEVFMMVPVEKGGGFKVEAGDPPPPPPPDPQADAAAKAKNDADARKKAATKVGGQTPGSSANKGNGVIKPIAYEDLKKSRAKLLREALGQ